MNDPNPNISQIEPPVFQEVVAAFVVCCTLGVLIVGGIVTSLALL